MQNVGGLMVLFGAGSIVFGFIGMEFTLLAWVDNWGTGVGWLIRGALILVGGALCVMGSDEDDTVQESDVS